ncbi:hypothetical protein BSQ39_05300 [Loigolactobacillus backii]|uniref:EpsG family protein n=1 Tax=Loigolactobacillus backii TaxID=375175 RepID=UPI000C1C9EC9|nr:EpsG family protein [Loigolactobacillus backii]PIO83029.1 hypothetical protein BSQ39_05300 [Loigolactobacillus backii]
MLVSIVVVLFILNIMNSFRQKEIKVILLAFFAFLFIIFTYASSEISDYSVYEVYYNTPDFNIEPGFSLLEKISNSLGFSFFQFRTSIAILGFLILFLAVRKITHRYSYFLSIYFLFPFFYDVIQMRNFLMMTCAFYAATFLIKGTWRDVLLSIIWILIAGSIHLLGYIFLVGILIWLINKHSSKAMNIILIIIIVSSILLIIPGLRAFVSDMVIRVAGSSTGRLSHLMEYSNVSVRYGFIIGWIRAITAFMLVFWTKRIILRKNLNPQDLTVKKINMLYSFVTISLLALPLLLIDADFERVFRNVFVMVICACALVRKGTFTSLFERYLFNLLVLVVIGFNVYGVINGITLDNVHLILFNNTLFS